MFESNLTFNMNILYFFRIMLFLLYFAPTLFPGFQEERQDYYFLHDFDGSYSITYIQYCNVLLKI